MACHIETLANNPLKSKRGLTRPHVDFITSVKERVDLPGHMVFLRTIMPVPLPVAKDEATAIDSGALWPTLEADISVALAAWKTMPRVSQGDQPSETDDGESALWVTVIVPIPRELFADDYDIVAEIVPEITKAAIGQIRDCQAARRLRRMM